MLIIVSVRDYRVKIYVDPFLGGPHIWDCAKVFYPSVKLFKRQKGKKSGS